MKLTDFQVVVLVLIVVALLAWGVYVGITVGAGLGDLLGAGPSAVPTPRIP